MIVAGLTVLGLGLVATAAARRARARRRALARRRAPKDTSWHAAVRFASELGEQTLQLGNRPGGWVFTRQVGDVVVDAREPAGIPNLVELAADVVSERIGTPWVEITFFRTGHEGALRRALLEQVNTANDRFVGLAEIQRAGGRTETRNYAGATAAELARNFVRSQLQIAAEEGLFA